MKIFLNILGFIFSSVITVIIGAIIWMAVCNCNVNTAIRLLSEGNDDVYASVIICMGLSTLFVFCPIMFEINRVVEDKFY